MKNIIKRGTSLLLVLAMLLSFAAVVGAADERLPVEGEKPVTLSLDSVVLRQGSTDVQYVPVRLTIEPGFAITGFQLAAVSSDESAVEVTGFYPKRPLKIYEDGSVNYDETIGTIFGKLYSNYGSSESKDPVQKFACANGKGVTSETISTRAEDGVIKEPDLAGYIGVKVKDGAQSGAYQLSIIPNASRDRDTTKRNDIVFTIGTQNTYTDAYATLNAGTAIVLPEGVNLPTVILTDDTFAVPTWEQMQAKQDKYPLASRMKIVGNDNKLYDVDAESLVVSAAETLPDGVYLNDGKTLELATRAEANTTGISLTVKSAKAVDADISISAPATVTAKISKADRGVWKAGFATNAGYYVTDTSFEKSYSAPEYKTPEEAYKYLSLNPSAIDYYGKKVDNYGVTSAELEIYSDAQHQNRITTGDVLESVKFTDENCNSLKYGSLLKQDVWCRVRAVVTVDENTKLYGDWLEFQIVNKYPQAARATVVLGDMNGNEFPSGPVTTIDIPYGTTENKTFSIIVKDFRQADGKTMPEGTEPSATDVTIALDGTYTGVSISNDNKLVIDKTAQAGTVTVKATLNGKELGTLPLTLQRAASKATDAGVYDCENKTANTNSKVLPTLSGVDAAGKATLPGIREGDKLVLTFGPGCVVDQYDEIYQVEGKNFLRPSQYALYKQSSTNPETYELCAEAERSVNAEGVVTATIKNSLDSDGNLRVQPGTYKFGTFDDNYNDNGFGNFDLNQKLMSEPFELVYGESEYTGTASYTGGAAGTTAPTVEVPYQYGTETKANTITVSADIKDQYNTTLVSDPYTYTLDEGSIKLNNKQIETGDITFDGESGLFTVNASAAKYFGDKTEIELKAKMTATYGTGANEKVENIPISITLRKDASKLAHLKVTGTASDGTTGFTKEATILDDDVTASYNLIVPNEGSRTYTIALSDVEDQYGTALTDKVSRAVVTSGLTAADALKYDKATKTLTVRSDAAGGKAVLTFTESGTTTGHKVELTLNFAQMSFVNSDGADYKVGMWLNTNPKDYAGQTWAELYNQIKWGAAAYPTVHIENEDGTAGQDVTSSVKVVVKKDGAEVFDSSKTYTEQPKANAGTYTIELIYVKDEGEGKTNSYPIDSFTNFTISPKTVKITVNGAITKEYDGTANLPDVTLAVTAYETLNVDKSVLKFAQENVGTDINVELTSADANCLKTASGEPATNYTADLSELKGTITARKLIVTPNKQTFTYGQDTEINAALASEYTVSNNLEGTKAAKITGSMKLTTTSGADVTVYNAGTYNVVLGNLNLTGTSAGNYQLELASGTHTWTISRKLLTKVKNSGLPQSAFGVNTDQGCISHLLRMFAKDADGSLIEGLYVSDFVDESKLSFPSNTVVTGPSGKQYPVPKTYTLTVTNKPTKDIGKNYRVDDTTEYEFDYTVNRPDASLLTVTLTGDTYTYNGMEQGPTVSVTYKNQANDTLDLTSCCTIGGTTKATDAGTYTITVTSDLLSVSKTATWKINPKTITKDMFSQKTPHPVYDGKEQTLTGSVLDGKDSGIKVNGENKVLKLGTDFTAAEVKQTNAGEYTMTVTGQGNYTGTADVKVKIDKFVATGENLLLSMSISSNQVTRGKTTTLYIDTAVLLKSDELEQFNGQKEGKVTWVVGKNTPNATINVEALENQKKLKVTVTVPNDATPDKEHAQIAITLQTAFNVDGGTHQNIESGQVRTYQLYVTDKEQQENFKIDQGESGTYSYSQGSLQLTASGSATGSTVTWSSSDTSVATVDNGKVTFVKPGDATITATASETDDYAATSDTYTLTITKGQVTVSASSATMTANDPLPGFSATASGLNPNDSVSEVFQTLTASAGTDGKTAGTFRVTPNATFKTGGRKNWSECYDLYFVAGTLTVNPAQTAIDVVLPIIIGGNTCANGYANSACESFYDLDASRWYHEAIDWAYSLGLMNGTTKSTFGPNAAATRAQTWTMLARIAGQDTRRSSTWYEVGQKWAVNLGITDGTNPMGSLTREQLAAMLYRYVGSPAVNGTLTFTDSANVSTWARNAMIWAVQNGILDGVGGNRLNPKGTTTRAQAAAIFMRFSKLINK